MADLKDVNVAILVDDGFEEVELVEPGRRFADRIRSSHSFLKVNEQAGEPD